MRKILLSLGLITAGFFSANAQDISENAIGLRFSGGNGVGGEITYQRALGKNNRLEIDLGLANEFNNFKATGLYQWVWNLEDKFNWYAGAGGGVGSFSGGGNSKTFFFGSGVLGLEYNFDAPILISLDYRPEFGFSDIYDGLNSDIALSVRYQF